MASSENTDGRSSAENIVKLGAEYKKDKARVKSSFSRTKNRLIGLLDQQVAKQFLVESSPFSESLGRKYCAGTVLKKKSFNSLSEFRLFCCQSIIGKYAATKLVAERGSISKIERIYRENREYSSILEWHRRNIETSSTSHH